MKDYTDPTMKVHDVKMYTVIGKDNTIENKRFKMTCWTADLAFKNNKVYFYFSNEVLETGFLVAD